jgi:hypothetical protein
LHCDDYDDEFDDKLSYDRGVIPPALPSQESYNKPDNWIERNRIGLEKVKDQLQTCIDSVSHGNSFNLMLTHNRIGDQVIDNEEPIVWNEPVLDEHWDQLEDALSCDGLVTFLIGIENVEMKKEWIAALVDICSSGRATISSYVNFNNANVERVLYLFRN